MVRNGQAAVPYLMGEAIEGNSFVRRGWSIVGLARIGGPKVESFLLTLQQDARVPKLVRAWSLAARIAQVRDFDALIKVRSQMHLFPSSQRPLRLKVVSLLQQKKKVSLEKLLRLSMKTFFLRGLFVEPITSRGSRSLLRVMMTSRNDGIRRQATAYLGNLGNKNPEKVGRAVVRAYRFRSRAKDVSWKGGALFVPAIRWPGPQARALVKELVAWYLWAELNNRKDIQRQLHNNLRSLGLARAAGYRSPGWKAVTVDRWLAIYGKMNGCESLRGLLKQQRVLFQKRYQSILISLACTQ